MGFFRHPSKQPLWRDEFSIRSEDERYVNRRQFTKFLVLTSMGMFVGNLWILFRGWFRIDPVYASASIAKASEIPIGGVKLFRYPGPHDPCIMVRLDEENFVAYSQKCTHLSCAVYYDSATRRLVCPCHEGFFGIEDGRVLQGPPPRPLPRVVIKREGDDLVALRMEQAD